MGVQCWPGADGDIVSCYYRCRYRDSAIWWWELYSCTIYLVILRICQLSYNYYKPYTLYRNACAIADKDSTIITGGMQTMKVVARYNLQVGFGTIYIVLYCTLHTLLNILYKGHVEDLPEMIQGRQYHGCGSYFSGGTMVSMVLS